MKAFKNRRRSSRAKADKVQILEARVKALETSLELEQKRCKTLKMQLDGLSKEADQSKKALYVSVKAVLSTSIIEEEAWPELEKLFNQRTFVQPIEAVEIAVVQEDKPTKKLPARDPSFHLQLEDVDSVGSRPSLGGPSFGKLPVATDTLRSPLGDTMRSNMTAGSLLSIDSPSQAPQKQNMSRSSKRVDELTPADTPNRQRLISMAKSPRRDEKTRASSPELRVVKRPSGSLGRKPSSERKITDDTATPKKDASEGCSVAEEEADKKFLAASPPDQMILTSKMDSTRSIVIHDEHGSQQSLLSNVGSLSVQNSETLSPSQHTSGRMNSTISVIDLGKPLTSTSSVIDLGKTKSTDSTTVGRRGQTFRSGQTIRAKKTLSKPEKTVSDPKTPLTASTLDDSTPGGVKARPTDLGTFPSQPGSIMMPEFSPSAPETKRKVSFDEKSIKGGNLLSKPPHLRKKSSHEDRASRSPGLEGLLKNNFSISETNEQEPEEFSLGELPISPFQTNNTGGLFATSLSVEDAAPLSSIHMRSATTGAMPNRPLFSTTVTQDSDSDDDDGGGSLFQRLNTARLTSMASIRSDRGLTSSIKRAQTARHLANNVYGSSPNASPLGTTKIGKFPVIGSSSRGQTYSAPGKQKLVRKSPALAKKKAASFNERRGLKQSPQLKPKKAASAMLSKSAKASDRRKTKPVTKRMSSQPKPAPARKTAAERRAEREAKKAERLKARTGGHTRSKSARPAWQPYG